MASILKVLDLAAPAEFNVAMCHSCQLIVSIPARKRKTALRIGIKALRTIFP
jgi:hypothetical protein